MTLRREENEEIMKGVLRWLLGPSFNFMPDEVLALFDEQTKTQTDLEDVPDLEHGIAFTGNDLGMQAEGWSMMFRYQEMVKFINQAIEWENVLYFVYPYFWDIPAAWEFIRNIRHPDAIRQAFLRAGSARVVLTVRKGWEEAWVNFVETGGFKKALIPGHPYMTIAQEIAAYDHTNYPGIPPANPGGGIPPDGGEYVATVSSAKVGASAAPVVIAVESSEGFHAGATVVLDRWESGVQETQTVTKVPDKTHLEVAALANAHDGLVKPFPVLKAGEKGQLIAEWFEYTPTSGTDIAVTSNIAAIA